tara:strand:- start:775 stop:4707 length:3933 start_codon:yes stop_codon:yes gene_type:complete
MRRLWVENNRLFLLTPDGVKAAGLPARAGDDTAQIDAVLTMVLSMDNVTFHKEELTTCRAHVDENNDGEIATSYNACRAVMRRLCPLVLNAENLFRHMRIHKWILNHAEEDNGGRRRHKKRLKRDTLTTTLATLEHAHHLDLKSVEPAVLALEHDGETYYRVPKNGIEVSISADQIRFTLSTLTTAIYSLPYLLMAFDVLTHAHTGQCVAGFVAFVLSSMQTKATGQCAIKSETFLAFLIEARETLDCTVDIVVATMKEMTGIDDRTQAIQRIFDEVQALGIDDQDHFLFPLTAAFTGLTRYPTHRPLFDKSTTTQKKLNKLLFTHVIGHAYVNWTKTGVPALVIAAEYARRYIYPSVGNTPQSPPVALRPDDHWQTLDDAGRLTVKIVPAADVYNRVRRSSVRINAMYLVPPSSNSTFGQIVNRMPMASLFVQTVGPPMLGLYYGGNISLHVFAACVPTAIRVWNASQNASQYTLQHSADGRLHVGDHVWEEEGTFEFRAGSGLTRVNSKLAWHGTITAFTNAGGANVEITLSDGSTHQRSADQLHGYVGGSDRPYDWDVEKKELSNLSWISSTSKAQLIDTLRKEVISKTIELPPLPLIVLSANPIPPLAAGGICPVEQLGFRGTTLEQLASDINPSMTYVPIGGDGNCQFTSVAVLIEHSFKHQDGYRAIMEHAYEVSSAHMDATWLRMMVVRLLRNPGRIQTERIREVLASTTAGVELTALQNSGARFELANQQGPHFDNKDAYINYIKRDQSYGDMFTLILLAEVAKSQISLYTEKVNPPRLDLAEYTTFNAAMQDTNIISMVATGNDETGHYAVLLPAPAPAGGAAAGGAAVVGVNPPDTARDWDDATIANELAIRGLQATDNPRDFLFTHWNDPISSTAAVPAYQGAALLRGFATLKARRSGGMTNRTKSEMKGDLDTAWPWLPPRDEVPQALETGGATVQANELLLRNVAGGGDPLATLRENFTRNLKSSANTNVTDLRTALTIRDFPITYLGRPTTLLKAHLYNALHNNWPWVKVHPVYTLTYIATRRVGHTPSIAVSDDNTIVARIDGSDVLITKFNKPFTDPNAAELPTAENTDIGTISLIKTGIQSILATLTHFGESEKSVTIVIPCLQNFATDQVTNEWYNQVKLLQASFNKHRILVSVANPPPFTCMKYDPGCCIASKWGVAILDLGIRGRIVIQMASDSSIARAFAHWCNDDGSRPLFDTINPGNMLAFLGTPVVPDANEVYVTTSYAVGWVLCYDTRQNRPFMIKERTGIGGQPSMVLGSVVHHGAVNSCMLSDLFAAGAGTIQVSGTTEFRSG